MNEERRQEIIEGWVGATNLAIERLEEFRACLDRWRRYGGDRELGELYRQIGQLATAGVEPERGPMLEDLVNAVSWDPRHVS